MQAKSPGTNRTGAKGKMPEKLKQRLYPEVLDLFSNNDFHRVTLREISKNSGLSSGTIYKYFSSKEDLIFAILDEQITKIGKRIINQIAGMVDIKEIFRKVLWVTLDYYDRNPGVAVTAFITVPMRTWMQDQSYKRQDNMALLKQQMINAKESNQLDPTLSWGQIIDAYYMICHRCIHNWYYSGMDRKLTDQIDDYFYLFWKILRPFQN